MEEYLQEILDLVKSNLPENEIKEKLLQYHDSDIADVFELLDDDEKLRLTRILGTEEVSDVLTYVDDKDEVLDYLKDEQAADIIENMDADDAVDVLQEMDQEEREKILDLIEDEEVKEDIQLIMSFDEDEVGSLMTTNYVTILDTDNVKLAMKKLIDQAKDNDNISTIFVTKDSGEFLGAIALNDIIIAREGFKLTDKMMSNYPFLKAHDKISDIINDVKDYAEEILPVLDNENILIGVLTASDIVEIVTSEANEDYHKLAGLLEEETPDESIFQSIKKRIPWLVLLLFLGLIVSTVVSIFEGVISSVTAAVIFQSVVFDMAGNGGTQSLAVTLTNINSEDELSKKKILQMIKKEICVGTLNGLFLGILSFSVIFGFLCIKGAINSNEGVLIGETFNYLHAVYVSASAGIALFIAVTLSCMLGLLLPIFFKKIKIDPAVASGPMITTVNDICSACIYYSLVGLFFGLFI
ncbi:MAG: magnesium transporter [Bacillales bacterium]|nr:magnesium transporter [Bacillales bacterium]